MKYISTRNSKDEKTFLDILFKSLPIDGGLYIPSKWPKVEINNLKNLEYSELAFEIIRFYCEDFISNEDLRKIINSTYRSFHHPKTAPLVNIDDKKYILELFYGPTFAFKDYALQFLGNILEYALKKDQKNITIIGATSGDTGSAAIEACKLKSNINIFILHPFNKVSEVQRRQMTTILEPNVYNIAVKGDFDDCQKIIKKLFIDTELINKTTITAINSINWVRIIAQSVYFFWAYLQMPKELDKINFIVPSGNFGNVYAAHVAEKMGLPIEKLHVVTNANDILNRTITKGEMLMKEIKSTYSPSMDIQVSSNFERQLFESLNYDENKLQIIMKSFNDTGKYHLDKKVVKNLQSIYTSYTVSDSEILETIKYYYDNYKYISDPHTATGLNILKKIENPINSHVSLACAHPAKFSLAVKNSINKEPDFPDSIKNIFEKEEKFTILDNNINDIKEFILNKI